MENRIQYFDFLRGIAVIMVVAIHAYPLSSDDGVSRVLRSLIGCAVPVFLAISGFFLSKKTFDNRKQYVAFLRRQVPKVYVPMLIWSLPMLTTVILKGDGIWQSVGYFFVGGLGVFYFIAVIIQCYVLLPILGKKPIGGGGITVIISFLSVSYSRYELIGKGYSLITYAGPVVVWLMFFVVGVLLGKRKNRAYSLIPWISLLLVSIIAMQVETSYLDSHSFKNPTGIKPSSHFYALVIVFVLFSEKLQKCISSFPVFEKYIAILGRTSFGIYLIHLYILNHLVTKFCHRWIIATLLTVLLSWLVVSFGRHVLGNKSKWLGFKI